MRRGFQKYFSDFEHRIATEPERVYTTLYYSRGSASFDVDRQRFGKNRQRSRTDNEADSHVYNKCVVARTHLYTSTGYCYLL